MYVHKWIHVYIYVYMCIDVVCMYVWTNVYARQLHGLPVFVLNDSFDVLDPSQEQRIPRYPSQPYIHTLLGVGDEIGYKNV